MPHAGGGAQVDCCVDHSSRGFVGSLSHLEMMTARPWPALRRDSFALLYWINIQYRCLMGFKPPLPTDELRQIQERNPDSADVRALLWEIKRMRATLLYADQLQRMLTTLSGPQGAILDTLRDKLKDEPCVKEFPRLPPGA